MEVNILNESEERVEVSFRGVPVYIANALRRYAINGVPVYAIDKVIFYENNSSFFDEYIAHRIGLLPIITPDGAPDEPDIAFYLDAVGPKKVYSQDLKSTDNEVKVAVENIPIVTLLEGQSIRLEGRLKKGIGRKHAKFQSGIASYEIKEDGEIFFWVESLHHMSAREVLRRAIKELISKLTALEKNVKEGLKD